MNISYKEIGYDYDKDDCEEEELFFITYKENKELLDIILLLPDSTFSSWEWKLKDRIKWYNEIKK